MILYGYGQKVTMGQSQELKVPFESMQLAVFLHCSVFTCKNGCGDSSENVETSTNVVLPMCITFLPGCMHFPPSFSHLCTAATSKATGNTKSVDSNKNS